MWKHKQNFTYAALAAAPTALLAIVGYSTGWEGSPFAAAVAAGVFIVALAINYAIDFYARQYR